MPNQIGFRINTAIPHPSAEQLEMLRPLETPNLSDGMLNFNAMAPEIKPVFAGCRILGPAVTLRMRPGDNLMLHKALGVAQPGDVLVVDTCGCHTYAVLGELIAMAAFQAAKLSAIVVDGGIRDVAQLRKNRFPVFARFAAPCVGDKDGPGEINFPISCGGVPVHPGDIIAGDDNGVVVVPLADAEAVAQAAAKKLSYEDKRRAGIHAGVVVKPEIDEQLRMRGVIA